MDKMRNEILHHVFRVCKILEDVEDLLLKVDPEETLGIEKIIENWLTEVESLLKWVELNKENIKSAEQKFLLLKNESQ